MLGGFENGVELFIGTGRMEWVRGAGVRVGLLFFGVLAGGDELCKWKSGRNECAREPHW